MNHYLVDYENVGEAGLNGLASLAKSSVVYIFFTKNANKINMESLLCSESVQVRFVPTMPGHQELDKHLVSYLGYLIGGNTNNTDRYFIVSKDLGYNNIKNFWNSKTQQPDFVRQTINIAGDLPNNISPNSALVNGIYSSLEPFGLNMEEIKFIVLLALNTSKKNVNPPYKTLVHNGIVSKFGMIGQKYFAAIKALLE